MRTARRPYTAKRRIGKRRIYQHPEQVLHKAVAEYLAQALEEPAIFTTFPLGGGGARRGAMLVGLGVKRGWPDIQIVANNGCLYLLELKTEKGRLSAAQQECHAALVAAGCEIAVARSLDEVEDSLLRWRVPLRARLGGAS